MADYIIQRDASGIATVRAETVADLFAGQGYATAQDRLWQLECDRRRAAGTLAEITGQRGQIIADSFARRARLTDAAKAGFDALDAETQAICQAYMDGVNTYLAQGLAMSAFFAELDAPRPEPFQAWEVVAIFLTRHITFATFQNKLWYARVLATLGAHALTKFRSEGTGGDTPVIVPPGAREATGALLDAGLLDAGRAGVGALAPLGLNMSGSNCWAVHGSRTTSGLPLIAGDPHRAFEAPNVYYQIRLKGAGIDAAGIAFPGIPGFPHFGQNEATAWGVTNATADYQDLFVERLPAAVLDMRRETVLVKGGDPLEVECAVTRHGPIVVGSTNHGIGVALRSSGLLHAGASLRTVLPQLRARNVEDLDEAVQHWTEPANNFVLADNRGTIAYRTGGSIPIRTTINAWLPVPGWSDEHEWQGTIADAALPRARNPETGAIVTANQRVTDRGYAHFLGMDAAPAHRAERIWARLADRTDFGADNIGAIQLDAVCQPGRRFAELVGGSLAGWDGTMAADSHQAALYGQARHLLVRSITANLPAALRQNVFAEWEPPATASPAELRVATSLDGWIANDDTTFLRPGQTWPGAAAEALAEAETIVGDRTWGELHHYQPLRLGIGDRLDLGEVGGGSDCVMAMNQIGGLSTNALVGSTARYVWDLADRSRSGWVVPMGAHEDPANPHYSDQFEAWRDGRLGAVFPQDH